MNVNMVGSVLKSVRQPCLSAKNYLILGFLSPPFFFQPDLCCCQLSFKIIVAIFIRRKKNSSVGDRRQEQGKKRCNLSLTVGVVGGAGKQWHGCGVSITISSPCGRESRRTVSPPPSVPHQSPYTNTPTHMIEYYAVKWLGSLFFVVSLCTTIIVIIYCYH